MKRKLIKINTYHRDVQEWKKNNPDGTKAECTEELGFNKQTIYKWWDIPFKDPNDRRLTNEELHNHLKELFDRERGE